MPTAKDLVVDRAKAVQAMADVLAALERSEWRVGVLKSRKYPGRPKWDVGRVAGVLEARYRWMDPVVRDQNFLSRLEDLVFSTLREHEQAGPRRALAEAFKRAGKVARKELRRRVTSLGLVRTGFFRKNIRLGRKIRRGKKVKV